MLPALATTGVTKCLSVQRASQRGRPDGRGDVAQVALLLVGVGMGALGMYQDFKANDGEPPTRQRAGKWLGR